MKTNQKVRNQYNEEEPNRTKNKVTRQDKRKDKQELRRFINSGFDND